MAESRPATLGQEHAAVVERQARIEARARRLVGDTKLGEAWAQRQMHERDFTKRSKRAVKTSRFKGRKRERRAEEAVQAYAAAVFWAGVERDYADEIAAGRGGERLLDLEGAELVVARLEEALVRVKVVQDRADPADAARLVEAAADPRLLKGDAR